MIQHKNDDFESEVVFYQKAIEYLLENLAEFGYCPAYMFDNKDIPCGYTGEKEVCINCWKTKGDFLLTF